MKIEKKLILFSILAIGIGVATIVPLEYLMTGQGGASAQTITPWFDFSVPYVYVNLHQNGGNNTATWDGSIIQGVANFTFTPDAIALKNADAQIEYYRLRVYSDVGDVINLTYSMAISREDLNVAGYPGGCFTAITGSGNNIFNFADGTNFDGNAVIEDNQCGGGTVRYFLPGELPEVNYTTTVISSYIANYNGNNANEALTALRNANELYIDTSRIFTVAYHGNATSTISTITTMTDTHVLQHIELTKTAEGFVFGAYKEGTVPFPMQTP
jgi:hypothetical protein